MRRPRKWGGGSTIINKNKWPSLTFLFDLESDLNLTMTHSVFSIQTYMVNKIALLVV